MQILLSFAIMLFLTEGLFFFYACGFEEKLDKLIVSLSLVNVRIIYPHLPFWFSGVFRGYKMGALTRNGLIN